jgi:hypothetical protein
LSSDKLTINTSFGEKTVTLLSSGITSNGMTKLDAGSAFFDIDLPSSDVTFEDNSENSTATATVTITPKYTGV